MRAWGRALAVLVTAVTVAGGTSTATAEETDRLTGGEAAHAEAGELAAAETIVPMPDLGIAHRLPAGGMNLWRIPLSDVETGYGAPHLVKTLDYGGFSYDSSVTLTGDFGDITGSDDGTADHIIWHAQPNGGVLVWGVGGGSGTPQLWQDLRTGGWSYAASQPMVADVTGDGWDDLVVTHRSSGAYGNTTTNVWVFPNNGYRLSAPQLWGTLPHPPGRYLMADVSQDGSAELVEIGYSINWSTRNRDLSYMAYRNLGGSFNFGYDNVFQGATSAGWSLTGSRQLAGDVTGDGLIDLVTVHAQPNGGILVWMHQGCAYYNGTPYCFEAPVIWQDLRTGGWSFSGSRQHLADSNSDWIDDLISVHSQGGNPGMLVWRHLSDGLRFLTPGVVSDLKTGGWSYSASREGVARTYGIVDV
jgi:hypothetical protein